MHVPSPPALRRPLLAAVFAIALPAFVCIGGASAATPAIEAATISSRTERLLSQADALLEDQQWDDALETLALVMDDSAGQLVRLKGDRFLPLRDACQTRLARLPPDVLAEHRRRIDPDAEQLLDQGRRNRDVVALERVIDEYLISSATPEAALLLADFAIEQGDNNLARRSLGRLHPLLSDPVGRPIGITLAGVDLDQHWKQVEPLLRAPRASSPALYPDAGVGVLAAALARLTLVSILERDLDRAAVEIELLRHAAPAASGVLAGAEVEYVERLQKLLADAREWPAAAPPAGAATFAGDARRTGAAAPLGDLAGPIWSAPYSLEPVFQPAGDQLEARRIIRQGGRIVIQTPQPAQTAAPQAVTAVFGPWVLVRDGEAIVALELASGQRAVTKDGVLHQAPALPGGQAAFHAQEIRLFQLRRLGLMSPSPQSPLGPLEIDDGVLYGRVGRGRPRRAARMAALEVDSQVLGFGLLREGLQVVEFEDPEDPWRFSGPPLVEDGLAYLALDADEVRPRVAVACYSTQTGKQVWFAPVCSGPPAEQDFSARPPDVLTKQGGTLYFNTNMGAVAALAAADGAIEWIVAYPRLEAGAPARQDAGPTIASPCIAYRGRLLAAPVDSPLVFALDQAAGVGLWAVEPDDPGIGLLGVRGETLVAAGDLLSGLDINTGATRYRWPDSARSGIRGRGRGCLAGAEVFWPTRDAIYARNAETGAATRPPIDLSPVGSDGANLTAAYGQLVVAGREKLTVLGPHPAPPPDKPPQLSRRADPPKAAVASND